MHVLADKPWAVCGPEGCLGPLGRATAPGLTALAMDIMTNKHDVVARLRKAITEDPALFGGFQTEQPELPAIEVIINCTTL